MSQERRKDLDHLGVAGQVSEATDANGVRLEGMPNPQEFDTARLALRAPPEPVPVHVKVTRREYLRRWLGLVRS